MTFDMSDQETRRLLTAIKSGRAFLVLGAGASKTSKNRQNKEVKLAVQIAKRLAEEAGFVYSNESLGEVLEATRPSVIAEPRFWEIVAEEYLHIRPSPELAKLFSYSWMRCYTWNIDDSVQNVKGNVQARLEFNGITDSVYTDHSVTQLPLIHLHGQAQKPESGFIFSPTEYNSAIIGQRHKWYKQLAIDYGSFVPIFVGSTLNEPILSLELDRARPDGSRSSGQAFLVDPSDLSPIRRASLRSHGIVHLQGDLADFVGFLDSNLGPSFSPTAVASSKSSFAAGTVTTFRLSSSQIEAAQSIRVISASLIDEELRQTSSEVSRMAARNFLEGGPPNWRLARSDASIVLAQRSDLDRFIQTVVSDPKLLMGVVTGQLGSGKTTALLQAILHASELDQGLQIFEIKETTRSLRESLGLLMLVAPHDKHAIIYFEDISTFGDSFSDDIELLDPRRFTVLTSVRTGEWKGRIGRRLRGVSVEFNFQRFGIDDYEPLIAALLSYVPSPALLRLPKHERIQKLATSNSQLLIALKEATSARAFNDQIADEYTTLERQDYKYLLLLSGLGSLARTGVSRGALEAAYSDLKPNTPFEESFARLEGVISEREGRVGARHELYVRHIFENVADLDDILDAISSMLSTFSQIRHPVIKNVPRLDSVLFKFLLNHNFVKDLAFRHGFKEAGLKVYERFDREFQLDGHFWLQYGQYLTEIRLFPDALDKLVKSIDAYPQNQFAIHALADLQLKVAKGRQHYDAETKQLIRDAVEALNNQDASRDLGSDYYPIVTLANEHIAALFSHRQDQEARKAAEDYSARIQHYRKTDDSEGLRNAHRRLLTFLSTGELIGIDFERR
jgi:hypothetical protein